MEGGNLLGGQAVRLPALTVVGRGTRNLTVGSQEGEGRASLHTENLQKERSQQMWPKKVTKNFLPLHIPLIMLMLPKNSTSLCPDEVLLSTVVLVATSVTTDLNLSTLTPYLTCLSIWLMDKPSRQLGLVMYASTYPMEQNEPPLS